MKINKATLVSKALEIKAARAAVEHFSAVLLLLTTIRKKLFCQVWHVSGFGFWNCLLL